MKNKIDYIFSFKKDNIIVKYQIFFFNFKYYEYYIEKFSKNDCKEFIIEAITLDKIFPLKDALIALDVFDENNKDIIKTIEFKPSEYKNKEDLNIKINKCIEILWKRDKINYIPIYMSIHKKVGT